MRGLRLSALLLFFAFALSACALPVPVQVASWAIDGISYIATKKSIADHGLSAVRRQDCALLRVVNGKDICTDYEDETIVVVEGDPDAAPNSSTFVVAEIDISPVPAEGEVPRSARVASTDPVINRRDKGLSLRDVTIVEEVLAGNLGLFPVRGAAGGDFGTEVAAFETASGEVESDPVDVREVPPTSIMALPEDASLMRAWNAGLSVDDLATGSEEVAFLPLPRRKPPVPEADHLIAQALPEGAAIVAGWDGAEPSPVRVAEATATEVSPEMISSGTEVAQLAPGDAHAHQSRGQFGRIGAGRGFFRRR